MGINGLRIGNVVKWDGQFFVLANNPQLEKNRTAVLIPIDQSNATVHPSDSWPSDDPQMRVDSIEFVADTVQDWLIQMFKKAMGLP